MSITQLECREYMGHVSPDISTDQNFTVTIQGPAPLLERLSVASIQMFIAFHTPWSVGENIIGISATYSNW